MYTELPSNSQRSICLCLSSASTEGACMHARTQSLHITRSWALTTYWVSAAKSSRICASDRDSKSQTCQSPGAGTPGFYKGNFSWGFARTRCECLWQRS